MNTSWLFVLLSSSCVYGAQQEAFITSFVRSYDCSQEGRYTHEYHPYLLQATKQSLSNLESFLSKEGFVCPHRMVIMGYQEEGIASFLPTTHVLLDDEYVHESRKGRVGTAHNVFGFLTGFLLKDVNWLQQQWGYHNKPLVYHHMPERIALFNDYAYCFQQHAFGQDNSLIFAYRDRLEALLKQQQAKPLLQELANFWQAAYQGDLKSFSHQVLATQDILFSVEYARHVLASTIPVSTIYTGPDITYPIELLPCQEQQATVSAQQFVDFFGKQLVPVAGKKTAYVFCSFVDGVGKSTLLGNVINWKKYGSDIARYERVDNSSSQRATLYHLDDQVAILDLPAQLSHFVSKPDGYVFVPLAVAQQDHLQTEIEQYVIKHKDSLIAQYTQALSADAGHAPDSLYVAYVAVAKLFDNPDAWIPFEYGGCTYLFKKQDSSVIHVAVPLEGVQSRGLKVAHPAHMLFTKGLSLPMHEDAFMRDCATTLHDAGIEQLVLVDFLSMYPRSSRENIRVNFLVQELRKVYGALFDYEKSFYKTLVNGNLELFYDLERYTPHFSFSLLLETIMRTALFSIFNTHTDDHVRTVSADQITQLLRTQSAHILTQHQKLLTDVCQQKVLQERQALCHVAQDKLYHTVVDFSWAPLLAFSDFMQQLWTKRVYHPLLSPLWLVCPQGVQVAGTTRIARECRDQVVLAKIMPCLRAAWYVSLINLVHAKLDEQGEFVCSELQYPVTPVMVQRATDGMLHILQYPLTPVSTMPDKQVIQAFLDLQLPVGYEQDIWGVTHDTLCMQPLFTVDTSSGLFGLGYNSMNMVIKQIVDTHTTAPGTKQAQQCMTSSQLVRVLDEQQLWYVAASAQMKKKSGSVIKKRTIGRDDASRASIALMVRALATLEMIAKDPQVSIVTRRGVYEDFRATVLLLERIMLPRLFHCTIEGPLFEDYGSIEPVISWDVIASYQ